jgi:cell wall-associated NlpC family hydrolase
LHRHHPGGVLVLLMLLLTFGCATTPSPSTVPVPSPAESTSSEPEQMLRAEIESWLGTAHRMGGMSRGGIDCSGLVVRLYADLFDIRLPRTTRDLLRVGRPVRSTDLTAGDLVFFKPTAKYRHVGIYLNHGEFVHASTTHGVMISRMDEAFWRRCYLTGRRVR